MDVAMITTPTGDSYHNHSSSANTNINTLRRGSSASNAAAAAGNGAPRSLTVTKNVNLSSAVPEELRVQASEYLALYIKVRTLFG